ncbi:response regulator [Desulfogranum marinum]|uniref:ATP-binding response regulator n=1 Tax=Desulfogranum marinum TaxID=453220 RepID=UPI0029C61935|nr:response regulator [Desulfogranum marinum]
MKYKETFYSKFGEKSEALFKDLLYEYKYLQSLQRVTRGITHNYNNIFAGATGQLSLDSTTTSDRERLATFSSLIDRGIHNTEVLFAFARYRSGEKGCHSLQRILYQTRDVLQAISPMAIIHINNADDFSKIEGDFNELVLMLFYLVENKIEDLQKNDRIIFDVNLSRRHNEKEMVSVIIKSETPFNRLTNSYKGVDFFAPPGEENTLSGLGLHISREIAKNHGGEIRVDNNEHFSSFIVVLPTSEPKKIPVPPPVESNTPVPENHAVGREKKVFFLVEDDSVLLKYLASGLQRKGHIVFSTESCAEAVEEFKLVNQVVEVVLIDIGLTDCDGFECMKQLSEINNNVQTIFMSGDIDYNNGRMPPESSSLIKPFTIRQLEELVYAYTIKD